MVSPTAPNSTTGQWSLMNRASDVPPPVVASGVTPVVALYGGGDGRDERLVLGEEGAAVARLPARRPPPRRRARRASMRRSSSSRSASGVQTSLKRTLKRKAAAAGMTFQAGLPTSMETISRLLRCELRRCPRRAGRAARWPMARSVRHRACARGAGRRRGPGARAPSPSADMRAAAADLDGVAQPLARGGLADDRRRRSAARGGPGHQRARCRPARRLPRPR